MIRTNNKYHTRRQNGQGLRSKELSLPWLFKILLMLSALCSLLYLMSITLLVLKYLDTNDGLETGALSNQMLKLHVAMKTGSKASKQLRRQSNVAIIEENLDPLVTSCDSFLSNGDGDNLSYDYPAATSLALAQKHSWQFGFSTRLAAEEAKASLMANELALGYGEGVKAERGDLVLLCVHSVPDGKAKAGDVKKELFLRKFMNLDEKRTKIKNGNLLVGVMGARYAPDAIHGEVLPAIAPHPKLSLLGGGGTYGEAISIFQPDVPLLYLGHQNAKREHERVQVSLVPIGRLMRKDGKAFNIRESALRQEPSITVANTGKAVPEFIKPHASVPVFVFTGVSMNAGKSLSATHFIRGLNNAGRSVGASKITGTDYPKDLEYFLKGGADYGMTFAEFGFSSTHGLPHNELEAIFEKTVEALARAGSDAIVIELADGVRAPDAKYLLGESSFLRSRMTSLFVAAQNAPGGSKALDEIHRIGLWDKLGAVTGMITSSPLAVDEFRLLESERRNTNGDLVGAPLVFTPQELAQGKIVREFFLKKFHVDIEK